MTLRGWRMRDQQSDGGRRERDGADGIGPPRDRLSGCGARAAHDPAKIANVVSATSHAVIREHHA